MIGRLLSFGEGPFSGAILVLGRVCDLSWNHKPQTYHSSPLADNFKLSALALPWTMATNNKLEFWWESSKIKRHSNCHILSFPAFSHNIPIFFWRAKESSKHPTLHGTHEKCLIQFESLLLGQQVGIRCFKWFRHRHWITQVDCEDQSASLCLSRHVLLRSEELLQPSRIVELLTVLTLESSRCLFFLSRFERHGTNKKGWFPMSKMALRTWGSGACSWMNSLIIKRKWLVVILGILDKECNMDMKSMFLLLLLAECSGPMSNVKRKTCTRSQQFCQHKYLSPDPRP